MGATMSLVHIHVEARRALVATDTALGTREGKIPGACGLKVWALPHAGLVITGRGGLLRTAYVAMRLSGAVEATAGLSLDTARPFLEVALHDAQQFVRATCVAPAADAPPEVEQLFLVGWSASRQSMTAVELTLRDGAIDGPAKRIDRLVTPDFGPETAAAPIASDADMLEAARRQVYSRGDREAIGGRLHVAELAMNGGRFSVQLRDVGPIEDE